MRNTIIFYSFLSFLIVLGGGTVMAQQSSPSLWEQFKGRPLIKEGDKAYENRDYHTAEKNYNDASQYMNTDPFLKFRKGNTAYRNESWDQARQDFQEIIENEEMSDADHFSAYYNSGNIEMKEESWDQAIEKYKEALKLKPNDREAKYNLSYALMKRQESQDDQQDDENEEDNEDENDDQDQDQDQDQDDDKDNQDEQDKEDQPKQNPSQLTPEQAERILQALRDEEKDLLDQKEEEGTGQQVLDKDW